MSTPGSDGSKGKFGPWPALPLRSKTCATEQTAPGHLDVNVKRMASAVWRKGDACVIAHRGPSSLARPLLQMPVSLQERGLPTKRFHNHSNQNFQAEATDAFAETGAPVQVTATLLCRQAEIRTIYLCQPTTLPMTHRRKAKPRSPITLHCSHANFRLNGRGKWFKSSALNAPLLR